MNREYIAREIALYSAFATLIAELGLTDKDFNAEEKYINLKALELIVKHEEKLAELTEGLDAEEFAKELFMDQAQKVKNMLENMEKEGNL